ncbi:MAG: cupin domain-containing protein [Pseudomonadota bacterium]
MKMMFAMRICALTFLFVAGAVRAGPEFGYTEVYNDDGVTHFRDGMVPLSVKDYAPPAPALAVSARYPARDVAFGKVDAEWIGDWHPAPRRQFIIVLSGTFEIEVGAGEKRTFPAGSSILLSDTEGKGHYSRVVSEEPARFLAIPLTEPIKP